jgi:CubicO group peptidase (beta-lactamase class C family)
MKNRNQKTILVLICTVAVLFLGFNIEVNAQNDAFAQNDSIDSFIESQMTLRKILGLQLAIVKNNELVKVKSYGLANIEDSIAVDNETVFSINSITKAFVGVSVMQLVEQGKLDLNAEIKTYLSDLPNTPATARILSCGTCLIKVLFSALAGLLYRKRS